MITLLLFAANCQAAQLPPVPATALAEPGAQVIPTRYYNDRFFAIPATAGDSVATLLLDTGDFSRLWESFADRLGLEVESRPGSNPQKLTHLPAMQAARAVPAPALGRGLIEVTPPHDKFDTLMSRVTVGQLGADWFANRIWTLDYPGRRLLLHATPPPAVAGEHETPLGFPTDSAGKRIGHVPRIAVVIDGDSLNMLFDTGATIWLPSSALAAIGGNDGVERSVSLVWGSIFDRWRKRHPDWPVVDDGDDVSHAPLIRVPNVRIAGFDTGPVWFRSLVGARMEPPPREPNVPLVRSRFVGTVGGNVFRRFTIVLDYPDAVARFRESTPSSSRNPAR